MKNFIKILAGFILLFCIGLFITYQSINYTFNKIEKEHIVESISNPILNQTFRIS